MDSDARLAKYLQTMEYSRALPRESSHSRAGPSTPRASRPNVPPAHGQVHRVPQALREQLEAAHRRQADAHRQQQQQRHSHGHHAHPHRAPSPRIRVARLGPEMLLGSLGRQGGGRGAEGIIPLLMLMGAFPQGMLRPRRRRGANEEQIEGNSGRFVLQNKEQLTEDNGKCTVCLTEFENGDELRALPCLHLFHPECVDRWLKENAICPTCRANITDMERQAANLLRQET